MKQSFKFLVMFRSRFGPVKLLLLLSQLDDVLAIVDDRNDVLGKVTFVTAIAEVLLLELDDGLAVHCAVVVHLTDAEDQHLKR